MSFEFINTGLSQTVAQPIYGTQDRGITPGGPMDAFSMQTGNLLLKQDKWSSAIEFIAPPVLFAKKDSYIILTGAPYEKIIITTDSETQEIKHACVALMKKGSTISFENKKCGFRTYFCYRSAETYRREIFNSERKDLSIITAWVAEDKSIRVMLGPEYDTLENPEAFFDTYWKIGLDTNQMGMRLENSDVSLKSNCENMISGPVADGTVQLTKNGPIILLKHRQTVGGYPRIFNVIDADVDLLGQYLPLEFIKFSQVTLTEALAIKEQKNKSLPNVEFPI